MVKILVVRTGEIRKAARNIGLVIWRLKCLYEPDNKKFIIGNRQHHLLLCIQVYRSEMSFARENGSVELFKKLKDAGHYPYSDLDRQPVA